MNPVLAVAGMTVAYGKPGRETVVVRDVDLNLEAGTVVGLAGESGSGKSTLALAAIGYAVPPMQVMGGTVSLDGKDLYELSFGARRRLWGAEIGFVAQSASEALNPAMRIGQQLRQVLRIHRRGVDDFASQERELLERVGIPNVESAVRRYPHEFSGGQLQRIAIAIAIACRPRVLMLDEPTTGLDVQTQRQISALLLALVREDELAALYVSHNLALLGEIASAIDIMYRGEIVESGLTSDVLSSPRHPYTRALLDAVPSVARPRRLFGIPGRPPTGVAEQGCGFADRCAAVEDECRRQTIAFRTIGVGRRVRCRRAAELDLIPATLQAPIGQHTPTEAAVLETHNVFCRYGSAHPHVVSGVSVRVASGEAMGLVGESGSGKSTLLRAIAGSHPPVSGAIQLNGSVLPGAVRRRTRAAKRDIQLIFQNPDTSLNPCHTIGDIIRRPLRVFRTDVARSAEHSEIATLLESVHLETDYMERYPDELSGGQKQRVAIARAFAAQPAVLLCDEITSALDVSVQATVLELLSELAQSRGTALIFVSHDLAVVRTIAARIAVMKDGSMCEEGSADEIFDHPRTSYTQALLAAIPELPAEQPRNTISSSITH